MMDQRELHQLSPVVRSLSRWSDLLSNTSKFRLQFSKSKRRGNRFRIISLSSDEKPEYKIAESNCLSKILVKWGKLDKMSYSGLNGFTLAKEGMKAINQLEAKNELDSGNDSEKELETELISGTTDNAYNMSRVYATFSTLILVSFLVARFCSSISFIAFYLSICFCLYYLWNNSFMQIEIKIKPLQDQSDYIENCKDVSYVISSGNNIKSEI
eukprot:NODE_172_length_15988_cov_0.603940.p8 type:complete len:213 gc:universal NODE_172_length_15988_cov_0.603940:14090-13452(-)